ncbi:AMIN-like domain-containing (lipo)protein [Ornithinimicrobium flavum]|uniref:AMIN-like domain-containing (lipo)protein n=1 Tax=Ornithinimicrobium flavum TaxID=1288636 RepID=UPI0010700F5A|nr:hypothetical protein [Ornithinimicrobium flavum]
MSRRACRRTGAATAVAVLLLAGCQAGGEPAGSPTPTSATPTPSEAAPTTQDETSSEDATGTPSEDPTETAGEDPTETAPSAGPTGDATETGLPPSALPPWTDDLTEEAPQAAGSAQEITGVRTGRHEDFDRVVLDLTGDEPTLGWFARLVDEAVEDPSGLPLDVEGERFLQLGIAGIDWTVDSPDRYDDGPVQGQGTEVVTEVVFGALFEGQQQILVGLREDTDYRIFTLADPARIVIDVRHP